MRKKISEISIIILLMAALSVAVAGCGGNAGNKETGTQEARATEATKTAVEVSTQAEATTEPALEEAAEENKEESNMEPITLADDKVLTIKVTGVKLLIHRISFILSITNNSDKAVQINSVADSFMVNGFASPPIVLETIEAGQTIESSMSFDYDENLPDEESFAGVKIEGTFSAYDSEDTSRKMGSYPFEFIWEK